jgi:hypothetical protein
VAVQAAAIGELRAANAEQARLIATLKGRVAELERSSWTGDVDQIRREMVNL